MSYFDLLGVSENASDMELEQARTWLAETLHPDQLPGASAAVRSQFDEARARVDEAYNALKVPTARSEYEAWLRGQGPSRRSRPPGAEECRLCGSAPAVPLRFLDDQAMTAMFRFSRDMERVATEVNQLDNQALVRTYEAEWRRWE